MLAINIDAIKLRIFRRLFNLGIKAEQMIPECPITNWIPSMGIGDIRL
jgi:hypothetical protein